MTDALLDTLLERLQGKESLEVEFKRARGGLPKDLWPTISAFANTNGGWVILGIHEEGSSTIVEGLGNPDARLQELHDLLRNPQKISHPVCGPSDATIERVNGRPVIVIRVLAASRRVRPVYINHNPYTGTYVRRHTGDYLCSKQEVDRMMRNASDVAADSSVLTNYDFGDLDGGTVARYRRRFQNNDPENPFNERDDPGFLRSIGAWKFDRSTRDEGITVAGLLMFGTPEAIRDWRQRHLIDYRLLPHDAATGDRWDDRVSWEGNLLGAYEAIYPRLTENQPRPFQLEQGYRIDQGPGHVVMREALVNLLVHADYAETQASLVTRSPEGFLFRNPGSSRVPEDDLLSGDRSDPRNPTLVAMFRYIGLADEGGTGIPKILLAWRQLNRGAPAIDSGTERYEFSLRLRPAHLLSDGERQWLQSLGASWTEAEQLALLMARNEGSVDNLRLRRMSGQHSADASRTLVGLRDRQLLDMQREGRYFSYSLSSEVQERFIPGETSGQPAIKSSQLDSSSGQIDSSSGQIDSSSGQIDSSSGQNVKGSGQIVQSSGREELGSGQRADRTDISLEVWAELESETAQLRGLTRIPPDIRELAITRLCARVPLSAGDLVLLLGVSEKQVRRVLRELLTRGTLKYLYPDQPTHPKQRYVTNEDPDVLSLPLKFR